MNLTSVHGVFLHVFLCTNRRGILSVMKTAALGYLTLPVAVGNFWSLILCIIECLILDHFKIYSNETKVPVLMFSFR